jgi:arylsulfatase A-like enzyme
MNGRTKTKIVTALITLAGIVCVPLITWGEPETPKQNNKPNVILIVADDLGYGELTCQGYTKDIPTPNIDSIARRGVRFTNGYVSCPVCSPTRAGLLTGRYQQRFGHEFNPGGANRASPNFGLPLTETTLPARLKREGYATGMVGKWHLGFRRGYRPRGRGFDEFFGFLAGAHPYVQGGNAAAAILRGNRPVVERDYLTDAFRREALAFIERHKDQPFFLYLPFNAVHAPLQATATYQQRFPRISDPKRLTFAAMLSALDDAVGAVLKKVEDLGMLDNTLVVFISDNGGPTLRTTSGNGPLRGFKTEVYEGGIRVPFLLAWKKGGIPEGRVFDKPVLSLDIVPTVMAAVGARIEPGEKLDGVDLLPFLTDKNTAVPHEALFWRFGARHAVRRGDWKLVRMGRERGLFNLAADIGETNDLSAQEPEIVRELTAAWSNWNSELKPPLW